MRFKISFLILFSFLSGCAPAMADVLSINRFGGLNTDDDPLLVSPDRATDAENNLTDEAFGLAPRRGYTQFSTESCSGMWVFPVSNGSKYLITLSSNVLKATLGGTNFTVIIGTVNTSVKTAATSLGDLFYWSSADGMKYWDTTVSVATNPTLNFDNLVTHKGRLWGSGVTGDKRTIYVSQYLNGKNFALAVDPVDTDPARVQVQGSLDENISVLFASFLDSVIWAKASSFGRVSGSRRSNFESRAFSDNVGSAYPESFRDCDGHLRFLGTKRTVWDFDGANLISLTNGKERINELMKTVAQGDANSRSWTQTSAADWNAGVLGVKLDTTTTSGNVIFSADSNLSFGNTMNQTTVLTSSAIYSNIAYGTWTFYGNFDEAYQGGTTLTNQYYFMMHESDPNTWPAQQKNTGYRLDQQIFGDQFGVYSLWLATTSNSGSNSPLATTSLSPGVIPFGGYSAPITPKSITIERDPNGTIRVKTKKTIGSLANDEVLFTVVDTRFTSATAMGFVSSFQNNSGHSNLSYVTSGTAFSPITTISTFTSQSFQMGTAGTSWGAFSVSDQSNGGTLQYQIYTGTGIISVGNSSTYKEKQTISNGQTPTVISSHPYVLITATFTRTQNGQTPTLFDFTINWNEGSQLRLASLWTGQRYWLGCAISSTSNNIVLVYDRNAQWQKWRGINMDAATIYNSNPYFGSQGAGIFQGDYGNTDNNVAITAYYKSKRFVPGGLNYVSYFDDFYVTTANSADSLQTQYYVDGVNSPYSLVSYAMNAESGIQDVRLPFTSTMLQQGRTIDFLFTVSGTTNWRLVNANLYFTKEPVTAGN